MTFESKGSRGNSWKGFVWKRRGCPQGGKDKFQMTKAQGISNYQNLRPARWCHFVSDKAGGSNVQRSRSKVEDTEKGRRRKALSLQSKRMSRCVALCRLRMVAIGFGRPLECGVRNAECGMDEEYGQWENSRTRTMGRKRIFRRCKYLIRRFASASVGCSRVVLPAYPAGAGSGGEFAETGDVGFRRIPSDNVAWGWRGGCRRDEMDKKDQRDGRGQSIEEHGHAKTRPGRKGDGVCGAPVGLDGCRGFAGQVARASQ